MYCYNRVKHKGTDAVELLFHRKEKIRYEMWGDGRVWVVANFTGWGRPFWEGDLKWGLNALGED